MTENHVHKPQLHFWIEAILKSIADNRVLCHVIVAFPAHIKAVKSVPFDQ